MVLGICFHEIHHVMRFGKGFDGLQVLKTSCSMLFPAERSFCFLLIPESLRCYEFSAQVIELPSSC